MARTDGPDGFAHPGGAIPALDGWRFRPTTLLRRQRKRLSQLVLVLPPPGFTGRARLSVIGGRRREEFVGQWEAGCSTEIPAQLCPHLERLTARHFTQSGTSTGEAPPAPIPESPGVLAVPVGTARAGETVSANLLIEPFPDPSSGSTAEASDGRIAGALAFPRARSGAMIYLAPIFAAKLEPGEPMTALLEGLEHDRHLRLSLRQQDLPSRREPELRVRAAELLRSGRLEALWGDRDAEEAGAAQGKASSPAEGQTGMPPEVDGLWQPDGSRQPSAEAEPRPHPRAQAEAPSRTRAQSRPRPATDWPLPPRTALLDREELSLDDPFPIARFAEHLLLAPPGYALLRKSSRRREIGITLRLETAFGDRLAHLAHPLLGLDPFQEAVVPYATALWSQIMRESLRVEASRIPGLPRMRRLGFCPLFVSDPHLPARLGRAIKRWNKRHLSPRLECATPNDYFALVAELDRRRLFYRRRRR
ncbi:MAG: hypothetical protein GF330_09070 [Candidatus Eisenbacteria bacterium]|nr:hypothetical protein [Candidatus Eisenbacteria bacterium]